MPNWVTNVVTAPKHVIDAMVDEAGNVDFNRIKPMPDTVFRGNLGREEEVKYPGTQNWYGWSLANWGTKWNAGDSTRANDSQVSFDTAWSMPEGYFLALSEKFPDEKIVVDFADEDLGSNLGTLLFQHGTSAWQERLVEGSDEALDFACQLKYGMSYAEMKAEWDEDE